MTKHSQKNFDLRKLLPNDSNGYPYVVEHGNSKALYFDARNAQSRMRTDAPHQLELGYTRTMMAFLLLQAQPRDVLIVGLGGGSLSKFCYRQLPVATITTVEINPAVIALRDEFAIPNDNARFRVVCADAADYMIGKNAVADVILLDGFEDYGLPDALSNRHFYRRCQHALRDGGVLVANLWDKDATQQRCRDYIGACFDNKIATAGTSASKNVIAFAAKKPKLPSWPLLQRRAQQLQSETGLDFVRFLDDMRHSRHLGCGPMRWLSGE